MLARLAGWGESADFLFSRQCFMSIQSGNLEISKRFKGKPPRNWKNKIKACLSLCTLSQTNACIFNALLESEYQCKTKSSIIQTAESTSTRIKCCLNWWLIDVQFFKLWIVISVLKTAKLMLHVTLKICIKILYFCFMYLYYKKMW